jgi:tripartite-type tricarboxylate transporter receptor subunit TctC
MTMLRITRRALVASAPFARPALAQTGFPTRPIRLILPWPAGGQSDAQLRVMAEQASRRLGQPVVVDNRPGASGTLGAIALREAQPDGYTLSQMPLGVYRVPLMSPRPAFDPRTDFTWILQISGTVMGIVVRADAPWPDLPSFLAHAAANPGRVTYGSIGVASTQHLVMAEIGETRGLDWTHVPYRGSAEVLTAVIAGQIHAAAADSSWAPMVEAGQLRLLCSWGAERLSRFPQAPTLRESGIDMVATAPFGIAGPRGMDGAVLRRLHDALRDALYDPAHLAVLERFNQPVLYLDSAAYAAAALRQYETERANLRRVGMLAT